MALVEFLILVICIYLCGVISGVIFMWLLGVATSRVVKSKEKAEFSYAQSKEHTESSYAQTEVVWRNPGHENDVGLRWRQQVNQSVDRLCFSAYGRRLHRMECGHIRNRKVTTLQLCKDCLVGIVTH